MVPDDVRPFLNSHFLACRIMSKYLPIPGEGRAAVGVVAALKRYTWLSSIAPTLCEKKGLKLDVVFGEESRICMEMIQLLPSKIDRIHFHGDFS